MRPGTQGMLVAAIGGKRVIVLIPLIALCGEMSCTSYCSARTANSDSLEATSDAANRAQPRAEVWAADNTSDLGLSAEEPRIPVLTATGIVPMTQAQYDRRIETMGHLPVLSSGYVFGHTIPMPKTDKDGHIEVSKSPEIAPPPAGETPPGRIGAVEPEASNGRPQHRTGQRATATELGPPPASEPSEPIPVATVNGTKRMTYQEYDGYTRQMGHLPVLPKTYIFGNTIPMPKTDKNGNIHVLNSGHTAEEAATARQSPSGDPDAEPGAPR